MSIVKVKGKKDARAEQETAAQREQEEKLRCRALCMAVLRAMAMLRYGALSAVLQPYIAIARTLSWANRNVRRHRERKGCQQHRLSHHPHVLNKSKLCGGLATLGPKQTSLREIQTLIHSGSAAASTQNLNSLVIRHPFLAIGGHRHIPCVHEA